MDDLGGMVDDRAVERACEQVNLALSGLTEIAKRVWSGTEGGISDERGAIALHHRRLEEGLETLQASRASSAALYRRKVSCLIAMEEWCGPDDTRTTSLALKLAREGADLLSPIAPTHVTATSHSLLANLWSSLPRIFAPHRSS